MGLLLFLKSTLFWGIIVGAMLLNLIYRYLLAFTVLAALLLIYVIIKRATRPYLVEVQHHD